MKYKYVFLLGRAGCGKSALYRELKERIVASGRAKTCERVDDFPKLWAKLQADDALEGAGQERVYSEYIADDHYRFTNNDILNVILQEVNADVLQSDKAEHVIFIEFARPNYVAALRHFDKRILDNCIAIYMEVAFDICWARNVARHQAALAKGGDDHLVPRETMEELYLEDDQEAFVQTMRDRNIPVVVVNNEAEGEGHLKRQVEKLLKSVF